VIDLGTISGLRARNHELHAYCTRCERWHVLDLDRLIAAGWGNRTLPLRLRCRGCGDPGMLQVRPPMPTRQAAGWLTPP
jgi:ribosomal protein L37E